MVSTSDGLKFDGFCELLPCDKMSCGDAGEAVEWVHVEWTWDDHE